MALKSRYHLLDEIVKNNAVYTCRYSILYCQVESTLLHIIIIVCRIKIFSSDDTMLTRLSCVKLLT